MLRHQIRGTLVVAVGALLSATGLSHATTYTFNDPGFVSGSVDTSTGTIILDALTANPTSVANTVSGIQITFSSVPSSPSLTSQVSTDGLLDTFTSTSIPNPTPPPPNTNVEVVTQAAGTPTNWTLTQSLAVLTLSANHSCSGTPCDLIVGPGPYTNANNSFDSHSPFIDLEGKFVVAGITDLSITSLVVQFGTVPTSRTETLTCTAGAGCENPPPNNTPIPGALPLFTSGIGMLGFLGWRRKRRNAQRSA